MEAAAARRESRRPLRVKVITLGSAEVGKSCIIKRYCEKRFVSKYLATIGIDYGVTKVQVRDREIKVNIFDMAGHPFFYEVGVRENWEEPAFLRLCSTPEMVTSGGCCTQQVLLQFDEMNVRASVSGLIEK